MEQFIGKYCSEYYDYVLITAKDVEEAKIKLDTYLHLNKVEFIPISKSICEIVAIIE